jgi:glutamate N-acetyltransferase/amino-acid N-acetyltransferase
MTTLNGFQAAGIHCGLKKDERKDAALIVSAQPCAAAGVFTTNRVKAAPVLYDQAILARPDAAIRAVLINTGSANACTGEKGLDDTRQSAAQVAALIGCAPDNVLTLSTGVIGLPLPMDVLSRGIEQLSQQLDPTGWEDAAQAIMTTDTRPKLVTVQHPAGYRLIGIAKGAGMIAPNMATMLSVIVTDAAVPRAVLQSALSGAVENSFNRIVIDGDMSTNDTVLALANGASGVTVNDPAEFAAALAQVCVPLAQAIVRDGEGATKFVTIHVTGAPDQHTARTVARQIGTSALVKTAFYGGDPNWGRILCAAGYSGALIDPARLALWLLEADDTPVIQLVERGQPTNYDEKVAIALMQKSSWGVRLDLGLGAASSWLWTCDLSHDYVTINGHYRT